jgi:hypothetical protein
LLHFNPHPARWNSLRSLSVRTLSQRERVNRAAFTLAEQAQPASLVRHCEEGVSPTRQSSKFNGFDWIASSPAAQAPRNDKAIEG